MRATLTALICAAIPALTSGCHPTFDVTESGQTTIPASSLPFVNNIVPFNFPALNSFNLSQSQEFQNQGVNKNELSSVKLKSATLTISSPSGATFDFLDSMAFNVSADGQSDQQVASLNPVPKGQTQLSLTVDGVELLPYVAASSMSVTSNASGSPPSEDTTINATLVFEVVPNI